MPKPQGTYLRSQAPTKIVNQAAQALVLKQKVEADQRDGFVAGLRARRLDRKKLDDGLRLADALRKFAKGEPGTNAGTLLKAAGEFADLAQEVGEMLGKLKALSGVKEVQTAIGTAKGLSAAGHKLDAAETAANALLVAVAIGVFVAAIHNAVKKVGAKL